MTIFYLVRHGQANSTGLSAVAGGAGSMEEAYDQLTELGHKQAAVTGHALRQRIGPIPPVVIAGPLNRQQDTAKGIVAAWEDEQKEVQQEAWEEPRKTAGEKPREDGDARMPMVLTDPDLVEFNSDAVVAPYLEANPQVMERINTLHQQARQGQARFKDFRIALGDAVSAAIGQWDQTEGFVRFQQRAYDTMDRIVAEHAHSHTPVVIVTSGGVISVLIARALGADWKTFIGRAFTSSITVFSTGETNDGPLDLISYNEHAHLDVPDADGGRPLRRYR